MLIMKPNQSQEFIDKVKTGVLVNINEVINILKVSDKPSSITINEYSQREDYKLAFLEEYDNSLFDSSEEKQINEYILENYGSWESSKIDWVALCNQWDVEPFYDQVLEYWAVTSDTAYNLKSRGEVVFELAGLEVWGRTNSGQAFYIDDVIQDIYANK